jgi:scyllo-inosamine 4-kinase
MDAHTTIASTIFSRHGVDFATVRRGGGWTNRVWLADTLVLRLAAEPGRTSLLREVQLAAHFPPAVGYPPLVESGVSEGFAWTLARRLPGENLEDAWHGLTGEERATALCDLWRRAEAVHAVPAAAAAAVVSQRAWFNNTDTAEARAGLARVTAASILTPGERQVLEEAVARFGRALPRAPLVLSHGDLTLANALWHAGHVTALLDFEFALLAPVQLDLNHLVKCAFGPEGIGQPVHGVDHVGAQRIKASVTEIARPLLSRPYERDLLRGYAILLELWLLELWLAHPEGEGPLEQWEPLRRLRALANREQDYLAPLTG